MTGSNIDEQLRYFAKGTKKTMLPGATPYLLRHVDEAVRFAGLRGGERVLDLGCGMGRHAFVLAERGFRVEGLELSPHLVERMREFDGGRYGIPVHCGDIASAPAEWNGRFDAALGFFVLHHIRHLEAAFGAIARLLRPGGRAVFIEPNPRNPLYYVQIALTPRMRWSAEKGLLQMRPERVFPVMRAAGLGQPAARRFGFFPPFLRNRDWGGAAEAVLERMQILEPVLPFQMFRCERAGGPRG